MAIADIDFKATYHIIKNILLNPQEEWIRLETNPSSPKKLILTYALPLTAISAVVCLLFYWLGTYLTFGFALKAAIGQLILPLVTIVISAILTNEIAGKFDSEKNLTAAFKLITYSFTPQFLINIITNLSWGLNWLMIFSLYGIYLVWTGLPVLMKTSEDKKPVYTLAIVIIVFIVQLILTALFGIDRVGL